MFTKPAVVGTISVEVLDVVEETVVVETTVVVVRLVTTLVDVWVVLKVPVIVLSVVVMVVVLGTTVVTVTAFGVTVVVGAYVVRSSMICAFTTVVEVEVGIGPLTEVVTTLVEHFTGEVVEEDKVLVVVPVAAT